MSNFRFIQRLLHDISHIPEEDLAHIKTKLCNTCEKYSKIRVPYKYRKIIETLSKNSRIAIMKQDQGRGAVLMDRMVYLAKCLNIWVICNKMVTNFEKFFEKKIVSEC